MPKFDDYTQKTTPEDTDITLILDKTANVNKKTPFSGIWTWIVNKMTNAVIQNLQTTKKTVIGSINELNSKTIFSGNINNSTTETFELEYKKSYIVTIGVLDAGNIVSVTLNVVITGEPGKEGNVKKVYGTQDIVSISGNILTITTTSNLWIICTVAEV